MYGKAPHSRACECSHAACMGGASKQAHAARRHTPMMRAPCTHLAAAGGTVERRHDPILWYGRYVIPKGRSRLVVHVRRVGALRALRHAPRAGGKPTQACLDDLCHRACGQLGEGLGSAREATGLRSRVCGKSVAQWVTKVRGAAGVHMCARLLAWHPAVLPACPPARPPARLRRAHIATHFAGYGKVDLQVHERRVVRLIRLLWPCVGAIPWWDVWGAGREGRAPVSVPLAAPGV